MLAQYFVQTLFAVTGILSLSAAIFNWEWFFSTQNVAFLVRNLGKEKARLFYGILGLALIGTAVLLFLKS